MFESYHGRIAHFDSRVKDRNDNFKYFEHMLASRRVSHYLKLVFILRDTIENDLTCRSVTIAKILLVPACTHEA